jgi:hypothetical protein
MTQGGGQIERSTGESYKLSGSLSALPLKHEYSGAATVQSINRFERKLHLPETACRMAPAVQREVLRTRSSDKLRTSVCRPPNYFDSHPGFA